MRLDDGPRDGQTKTHAAWLRCREVTEQPLRDLGGDAGSIVFDREYHDARLAAAHIDGEEMRRRGRLQGVDRIRQQILQDPLDLQAIRMYEGLSLIHI